MFLRDGLDGAKQLGMIGEFDRRAHGVIRRSRNMADYATLILLQPSDTPWPIAPLPRKSRTTPWYPVRPGRAATFASASACARAGTPRAACSMFRKRCAPRGPG